MPPHNAQTSSQERRGGLFSFALLFFVMYLVLALHFSLFTCFHTYKHLFLFTHKQFSNLSTNTERAYSVFRKILIVRVYAYTYGFDIRYADFSTGSHSGAVLYVLPSWRV